EEIGKAGSRLDVVRRPFVRILGVAAGADEPEAAAHLITGKPLLIDEARDGINGLRVEAIVDSVLLFEHRCIEVPTQAEVQRETGGKLPVVLHPWRVVVPAKCGEEVVVNRTAARRAEQKGRY